MNTRLRAMIGKRFIKASLQSLLYAPLLFATGVASAMPFYFSTGDADGAVAMASRPGGNDVFEIEAADDFVLNQDITLTNATFTGLLVDGATINHIKSVDVEIYRVFPYASDTTRTPSSPTRVNSPSDVALTSRGSNLSELTYSASQITSTFAATNSVLPGGVHSSPNQTTLGSGPIVGEEVLFKVDFTTPLNLLADHYFFVPQVEFDTGEFLWLSAAKPIVLPGTPFLPDLQAWTRDESLDPDWLRVGGDILSSNGSRSINAAFTLSGDTATSVPEPGSLVLMGLGLLALVASTRRVPKILRMQS